MPLLLACAGQAVDGAAYPLHASAPHNETSPTFVQQCFCLVQWAEAVSAGKATAYGGHSRMLT